MIHRDAVPADGAELGAMAQASFVETFGTLYPPRDLATFLDEAFGPAGLPAQIAHPDYAVRVAVADGAIVGFAKLGPVAFPGSWPAGARELHQLYVLKPWQGCGTGPALIDWAIATARAEGAPELLLSVFVDNHRARGFYERRGFVEIGTYAFPVGETIDDDRILRLVL